MLTNLIIKNFILIENLTLSFGHKLTVLTGETGAGKSILLDAVSFVLGARSDTSIISKDCEQTSVCATFDLQKNHPAITKLIDNDILSKSDIQNQNEIIIRRVLNKDGKNKIFINDIPVSLTLVKSIGEDLIEIHGQFDNQSLLNPATHINTLDTFGNLDGLKEQTKIAYNIWQDKKNERIKTEEEFLKAKQDEEYLKHNLAELETLNPQVGEEEELNQKRHLLQNSEKIITAIKDCYDYLSKYGDSPEKFINEASYSLERIPDDAKNDNIKEIISELETTSQNLCDAYERLSQILSSDISDTQSLEETEERLFTIRELARKHKITPDELPTFTKNLREIVENINNSDNVLNEKKKAEDLAKSSYIEIATKLSEERKKTGSELSKRVLAELAPLKLEKATFETAITTETDEKKFGPNGINTAYFMGTTNVGGKKDYIHKIASGGELARFTLAIKVVISNEQSISSMIFDEVDTGISGATASAVGERLATLSKHIQTMVITHSPQVASFGNHHFKVEKYYDDEKNKTITSVNQLSEQERIQEIARIISGDKITTEAIEAAKSLFHQSIKA
ncbi:DNA repair protein RecN [bacterium]|nr:DNA repair protein RecN [bacterium]